MKRMLSAITCLPRLHERDLLENSLTNQRYGPWMVFSLLIWTIFPVAAAIMGFYLIVMAAPIIFGPFLGSLLTVAAVVAKFVGLQSTHWFWSAILDHLSILFRNDAERANKRLSTLKSSQRPLLND